MNKLFSKGPAYYVHCAISLFLMFVLPHLVTVSGESGLTQAGAEMLCVLAGMVWGYLFCGMIFSGIFTLLAMGLTSYTSVYGALGAAFGSPVLWMMVAFGGYCGIFSTSGVSDWMAKKIISAKIGHGHPWILAALVFLSMFIIGGFTVGLVMMFAVWEIIYKMGENWGLGKDSDYMKFLIAGIPFVVLLCGSCLPFSAYSISYIGIHESYTGQVWSGAQYTGFILPLMLISMFAYILVARFLFKIDIKVIKEYRVEFDIPKLTAYQKIVLASLIVLVVACFAVSVLPASWGITIFLNKLGVFGIIFAIDAILAMCAFAQGEPFSKSMAKGLSFDLYFGLGAVMAIAAAISSPDCGISAWLEGLLTPIASNMSSTVFIIFILLMAAILTQISSNTVVIVLFATIVYSMADKMGYNPGVVFLLLTCVGNTAVVTPAACPVAGIGFANEWLTSKDATKYGLVECLVTFIVCLIIGIPLGAIMF